MRGASRRDRIHQGDPNWGAPLRTGAAGTQIPPIAADGITMLRRLAAGALILMGSLITNVGIVMWWFDREVTDPQRVREMATAVLQDPVIRREASELIVTSTSERLELDPAQTETLTAAATEALTDPVVAIAYADAMEQLYRAVFEPGTGEASIVLSTTGIEAAMLSDLEAADPATADLIEQAGLPATVPLPVTDLPQLADVESGLEVAWKAALLIGSVILLSAIIIHPRTAVAIRRTGILFALAAGLMAGAVWVITDLAAPRVPVEGFDELATAATSVMLASLTAQAIIQATVAVLVAIGAHLRIWLPRLTAPLRAVAATMVR